MSDLLSVLSDVAMFSFVLAGQGISMDKDMDSLDLQMKPMVATEVLR